MASAGRRWNHFGLQFSCGRVGMECDDRRRVWQCIDLEAQ